MVWLVMIYVWLWQGGALGHPTYTSDTGTLHVGTFQNMTACVTAAKQVKPVLTPNNNVQFTFTCVPSGTLN
jgi:hypothetical protein